MARVVVFKNPADLLELRGLLYGTISEQRIGIRKCRAYEVRGPLPPSVHATCLLVAARCDDIASHGDLYVIRQAYAMAVIRFVNEILDAAQVGRTVVPLHALAVDARLPSAFVELRHAATHEDLPSIYTLRAMAEKALQWLFDEFWSLQTAPENADSRSPVAFASAPETTAAAASPSIENGIKDAFREWRRARRNDAEAMPVEISERLRHEFGHHSAELLGVVFNRNILIPAGSGLIRNPGAVVEMWMPLFAAIGSHFCSQVGDQVIQELQDRDWPVTAGEHRKFAMLDRWAEELASYMSSIGVGIASGRPRPWNARALAKYANAHSRTDLQKVAEQMAVVTGVKLPEVEAKDVGQAAEVRETQGWNLLSWTPRPIGMY